MTRIRIPGRAPRAPRSGVESTKRLFVFLGVAIFLSAGLVSLLAPSFPTRAHVSPERDSFSQPSGAGDAPAEEASGGGRPAGTTPRAVILIDDMGRSLRTAQELLEIDLPISLAILPYLPYSRQIALEAKLKGRELLLHLPMEPLDYPKENPGPGGLFLRQSPEEWRALTRRAIDAVPGISGVNNHMGSRFTRNAEAMKVVLGEIGLRGLFFVDSYTNPGSVAYKVSLQLGLRTTRRTIFLDNEPEEDKIIAQIRRLLAEARETGSAFAIGHPHPTTIEALQRALPMIRASDVAVVPPSELAHRERGREKEGSDLVHLGN